MKRAAIASVLCFLHLAFILLPEVQVWQYIVLLSHQQPTNEISFNKDNNSPLTGDITYLKALIDRANDSQENQNENTIPEISISHTGLIYLASEASNCDFLYCKKLSWSLTFNKIPLEGMLRILAPPPKLVFA